MNTKKFSEAMNELDNKYVEKAIKYQARKRKPAWMKWGAVAACFALVLSLCILSMLDFSGSSGDQPMLALTVYAADGTEHNMVLNQSYLKSSISGIDAFGKDVPTFEFYVAPVEYDEEGDIFAKYDIELSYNGKVVEDKDEHVRLLYIVPQEGILGIGRYGIIGWFEETTDIIVTLKDRESGEIIEKMTVNVSYSEADEAYQMTVIKTTTE